MPHRYPSLIAAPAVREGRLWLTGGRLFDGTGGGLREGVSVLVSDGVIERVVDGLSLCPKARPGSTWVAGC
jgi:hypothetical protein